MKFSVCIPLFNKEMYIERTIRSVLQQTYADFELLVVNDGSTDGSRQVVEQIADRRLRIIDQDNGGESAARNTGIRFANGEFVAFLDADDAWDPQFLLRVSEATDRYPDYVAYGAACRVIDENGSITEPNVLRFAAFTDGPALNFPRAISEGCFPISSSSICIRRSAFEAAGVFEPGLRIGADIDMWLRLSYVGKILFINEALATYHRDATGRVTHLLGSADRHVDFVLRANKMMTKFGGVEREQKRFVRKFLSRFFYGAFLSKRRASVAAGLDTLRRGWHVLTLRDRLKSVIRLVI